MVSDWIIKKKLKDLKDSSQGAVHMKGKTTEVEKAAYSARREEVKADIILTEEEKRENMEVLLDYIEPGRPGASR